LDYNNELLIEAKHPTLRQYERMAGTSSCEVDTYFPLFPYERNRCNPPDEIERKNKNNKQNLLFDSKKAETSMLPGNFGCRFAERIPTDFSAVFK